MGTTKWKRVPRYSFDDLISNRIWGWSTVASSMMLSGKAEQDCAVEPSVRHCTSRQLQILPRTTSIAHVELSMRSHQEFGYRTRAGASPWLLPHHCCYLKPDASPAVIEQQTGHRTRLTRSCVPSTLAARACKHGRRRLFFSHLPLATAQIIGIKFVTRLTAITNGRVKSTHHPYGKKERSSVLFDIAILVWLGLIYDFVDERKECSIPTPDGISICLLSEMRSCWHVNVYVVTQWIIWKHKLGLFAIVYGA